MMTDGEHRSRRLRLVRIADTFLPVLLGAGPHRYAVTRDALPPDARVVNCRMDDWGFVLTIESAAFSELVEGMAVPEIHPRLCALPAAEGAEPS
jgi:hypothetical protein